MDGASERAPTAPVPATEQAPSVLVPTTEDAPYVPASATKEAPYVPVSATEDAPSVPVPTTEQARKRKNADADNTTEPKRRRLSRNQTNPVEETQKDIEEREEAKRNRGREPHGSPRVWAEKRAALSDSLPYFRIHQGSLQTQNMVPKGMLIDSEVGPRDYFGSQVIITSIGGGRVRDESTGKMTRETDQNDQKGDCKALLGHIGKTIPVIAGAGHSKYPVNPPHYYCVLGHFQITDIWAEKSKNSHNKDVKFHMIRLEKVDLKTRSWFAPKGVSPEVAGEFLPGEYACEKQTCDSCRAESKTKFTHGWTCLHKKCEKFFKFGDSDVKFNDLRYNDNFLRERTQYSEVPEDNPEEVCPIVPGLPQQDDDSLGCEALFKRGIVCPKCGCCSNRIKWQGWYCLNDSCDFELLMPIKLVTPEKITLQHEDAMLKFKAWRDPEIIHEEVVIGLYKVHIYLIPVIPDDGKEKVFIGSIIHFEALSYSEGSSDPEASDNLITRTGGFNDLYEEMQTQDIKLERRGAKNANHRIEELTSHFSANFGAPYKFGVVVKDSVAFANAPKPVMETLLRLTWAGGFGVKETHVKLKQNHPTVEHKIPEDFKPFNEELVLGYFENSKIGAHDDGEKELGPTVASLSLGAPSVMSWHPKKPKGLQAEDKAKYKPALSILLKHGDMMVMHGELIQKYYNHSVTPMGLHRFAMTCRHIKEESILDPEQRKRSVADGKIPDEWAAREYNGTKDKFVHRGTDVEAPLPGTPA
ncbi:hypothetical protein F4821DRAFT_277204 [Hypoxylon rubiginosum]|uniref:Uncharacterized protein n=1 Tax=Hypoxylon rubiginosum TaxID=110542 RepID=A0ACC0D6V4_9PEZI|nr:hypothetical protein F4821DRAFT_277204 [Hypoxylon rubiginosum]